MSDPQPKTDGRRLRTERTRLAIAKAMTDLMNEGRSSPTREEIAARAGISVRALFLHFPNVHDLIVAELDRLHEEMEASAPLPPSTPLADRTLALLDRRAEAVARLAPHLSAAAVDRHPEPLLLDRIDRLNRLFTEEIRVTFDPEFSRMPAPDRAACTMALETLLAPMMWQQTARERGLPAAEFRGLLATLVLRLLGARS